MKVRTIILGAGAAGMFAASRCGPGTLVLDHAKSPGEKIRISGGGRCNFTNMWTGPENFISQNKHFAKSALSRFSPWDFVDLVNAHGIPYHEKTLGQLFCDRSAKDIIALLRAEMAKAGADLWTGTTIKDVAKADTGFRITVEREGAAHFLACDALVVATGGLSIPKIGASDLGYRLARQFGHGIVDTRPGLVPLTFDADMLAGLKPLAGVAVPARVTAGGAGFDEALLFTHRGLSGPAVLQASSYWTPGDAVTVHLAPDTDLFGTLRDARAVAGRRAIGTVLADTLPKRLAAHLVAAHHATGNLADWSDARLRAFTAHLTGWHLTPAGTEGFAKAEVTLGGIDTAGLNSRTMESKTVPNLFFIGEVVDVTGWLGGYNFQWAWASAAAAGDAIRTRPSP